MDGILKLSKFQMVLLGVFTILIMVGMMVLAVGSFGGGGATVRLTMWGTMSLSDINEIMEEVGFTDADSRFKVTYVQKDPVTYESELVEALAAGTGPDIFFMPHDLLIKHKNKVYTIPFNVYPIRDYTDTFVRESQLFVSSDGIYAIPFIIDPMVTYWNTVLFSNAGVARPPQYWDEYFDLVSVLTRKDQDLDISQSAFALGEYRNITHAQDIIVALLLQNEIPIYRISSQGKYTATFSDGGDQISDAYSVLNYYTQFSNSTNSFYTWNRSLPESRDYFIQTDLALYLGFASEVSFLREKNPNLSFDVSRFPQTRGGKERISYANITGLAIANTAKNKQGAFEAIQILTSQEAIARLVEVIDLPPVRLDTFKATPANPYMPVFQEMALWSKGWLPPSVEDADAIFRELIESITSGRRNINQSINYAKSSLDEAYNRIP